MLDSHSFCAGIAATILLAAGAAAAPSLAQGTPACTPAPLLDPLAPRPLDAVEFDDGTGTTTYIAAILDPSQGWSVPFPVLRRNGSEWEDITTGAGFTARTLAVYDDGSGPSLYAAGFHFPVLPQSPAGLFKWTGSGWVEFFGPPFDFIEGLEVYDDGTGDKLYIGGSVPAGGLDTQGLFYSFDGAAFTAVPGVFNHNSARGHVEVLQVFDDGNGPALYVGGIFASINGVPFANVARWDGSTWTAPGGWNAPGDIEDFEVLALNSGPEELYVSGRFHQIAGVDAHLIARFDGTQWHGLANGLHYTGFWEAHAGEMVAYDDGNGPALFVFGGFDRASGVPVERAARWDGNSWSALEDQSVFAGTRPWGPESFDPGDGTGRRLLMGGWTYGGCTRAPIGETTCAGQPNSTGAPAALNAIGATAAARGDVTLEATGLPQLSTTLFLAADTSDFVASPGGSAGDLCLGGTIGRFLAPGQLMTSDATGAAALTLDLDAIPAGATARAVAPGDTWWFQAWHRDGAGSNFTPALRVSFL
ncbi:MAG: hypothetical protein AAFU73_06970 [Planctomycetota bacterium]